MTDTDRKSVLVDFVSVPPSPNGEWYIFVHPEYQETFKLLFTEEIQIGQAPGL